jgi:hypothetical protein
MWKALLLTVLLAAAVALSRAQGGVDLNRTVGGRGVDGDNGGNHPDLIENFIGLDIGYVQ